MRHHAVLRVTVKLLLPFIVIFAFYVQFHGDYSPGGGFQAGVILCAAYILYALIFSLAAAQSVVPPWAVRAMLPGGVLIYGGVGVIDIILGGGFLDYSVMAEVPKEGHHIGILAVEFGVLVTVAGAMIAIFNAFAGKHIGQGGEGVEREGAVE